MENNVFPLPLTAHIIFVAVAFVFFVIQFIRVKYKYQLVMAAAAVLTTLVYVNTSRTWFYAVGFLEFGLLIIAFVASIVEKHMRKVSSAQTGIVETAETAELPQDSSEQDENE